MSYVAECNQCGVIERGELEDVGDAVEDHEQFHDVQVKPVTTDGGREQVTVPRDVLDELVDVAKGKLETDVSRWGPNDTGYDVDAFAETIEFAERSLEGDDGTVATDGGRDQDDTEYYVAGVWPDVVGRRRLHTDRNCPYLDESKNVRTAYTGEPEDLEVCQRCQGNSPGGGNGGDWGAYKTLRDADPDDLVTDGGEIVDSDIEQFVRERAAEAEIDGLWTGRKRIGQAASKNGFDRDRAMDILDTLVDEGEFLNWHGRIAPATQDRLRAIIESECEADFTRTFLIARCNRLLRASKDTDQELLTDGGRLPDEFKKFVQGDGESETLPCRRCGDDVDRRYLHDRVCVGCRHRRQLATDGGHVPGSSPEPTTAQHGSRRPPDAGERDWICPGCETPYHGRPEFIVAETGSCYCSIECFVQEEQFLRDDLHHCDSCGHVCRSLYGLLDHDCDGPPVPKVEHDGPFTKTVTGPDPTAFAAWEANR